MQNLDNKEHQKQIRKILDNENSVFLYSKKFFSFIENELSEEYIDEYQRLVTKFNDSTTNVNIKSSESSKNFDDEILHINSKTEAKVVVSIAYNQPSQTVQQQIPNIAVLSQQQKPNYHWLVINLAILHPNKITVREFSFKTNNLIKIFFDDIFSMPKHISEIYIFDTQCNLKHDKFDCIAKKINVNYLTIFHSPNRYPTKNIENKKVIKEKFGGKHKMFTTHQNNAHGRRIIFENIVVTCDNDYWNLEVNASDWCIDVQYSEDDFKEALYRFSALYKEQ